MFFYIVLFFVSCFFLSKAGAWAVKSLTRIAQFLQWSEFVVAFILMAFTTTLPEFFVGLTSAFKGLPEISFGNVIGSNIINLTLAVGWIVLLTKGGIKIENKAIIKRDSLYVLFIILFPFLLFLDKNLSRIDGFLLIFVLCFYLYRLISKEKIHRPIPNSIAFKIFLKDLVVFFGSVILLLISAEGTTRSAIFLAQSNGINLNLISTFLIAFGTNLPELTFGAKAVMLGRPQMALGNLMGAVIANSTSVLGITALISPLAIKNFSQYFLGIAFTILSILLFNIFLRTKNEISRKEAVVLILFYIFFIVLLFKIYN